MGVMVMVMIDAYVATPDPRFLRDEINSFQPLELMEC